MRLLTTHAVFACPHPPGHANAEPHAQSFVCIEGAHVLIGNDPGGLTISTCPLPPPNSKACFQTSNPTAGHSQWIRIQDLPVCLDRITGPAKGVPGGPYTVARSGQDLVTEGEADR